MWRFVAALIVDLHKNAAVNGCSVLALLAQPIPFLADLITLSNTILQTYARPKHPMFSRSLGKCIHFLTLKIHQSGGLRRVPVLL